MFFATAGRGTEVFLKEEILRNLTAKVYSVRDGKVFFKVDNFNTMECNKVMMLKIAERVFATIIDYDNSIQSKGGKKAFLDDFMTKVCNKDLYLQADDIINHVKLWNCQSHSKKESVQEAGVSKCSLSKLDVDSKNVEEPAKKFAKLKHGCHMKKKPDAVYAKDDRTKPDQDLEITLNYAQPKDEFDKVVTFRMSMKCSGRLKKRLDLKRLSRDTSWRVAQASGWKAQLRQSDIEVCVHISDDHVTVGVPLSREPLSRRNYLRDPGLRAPVAWIMCHLADIQEGDVVLDPMCGKATIILEGAAEWKNVFYLACDSDSQQLKAASHNLLHSETESGVDLTHSDSLYMPIRKESVDAIVCDAPFNKKHQILASPQAFYGKLLHEVCRVLRIGGRCVLLTSEEIAPVVLSLLRPKSLFPDTNTRRLKREHNDTSVRSCGDTQGLHCGNLNSEPETSSQDCLPVSVDKAPDAQMVTWSVDETPDAQMVIKDSIVGTSSGVSCDANKTNDNFGILRDRLELVSQHHDKVRDVTSRDSGERLELVSQHPVKLGETLALILKLIKR